MEPQLDSFAAMQTDKTDSVSTLHSPRITSVWSNVASMSQKQNQSVNLADMMFFSEYT